MGRSDWKEVSKEDHELNYILKKYGKSQSQENREKLKKIIDTFKETSEYSPHQHEDLYKYFDDTGKLNSLD